MVVNICGRYANDHFSLMCGYYYLYASFDAKAGADFARFTKFGKTKRVLQRVGIE